MRIVLKSRVWTQSSLKRRWRSVDYRRSILKSRTRSYALVVSASRASRRVDTTASARGRWPRSSPSCGGASYSARTGRRPIPAERPSTPSGRASPAALAAMRQGAAAILRSEADDRPLPVIVFHGDSDATVHPRNGEQVIRQFRPNASSGLQTLSDRGRAPNGCAYTRTRHLDADGKAVMEMWILHGAGHAWAGGSPAASYTDPEGPDASREMVRFFLQHRRQ